MDMGFAIIRSLTRHRKPLIRFLFIGSRLCSALLSGPASRRVLFHPCASLSLHVHHVVKRTFTSKLSNVLGTQKRAAETRPSSELLCPPATACYKPRWLPPFCRWYPSPWC